MILKYVLNKNSFMYKAGSKSTLSRKYAYIVFVVELKLSGIIYILYDQGYLLISTHTPPQKNSTGPGCALRLEQLCLCTLISLNEEEFGTVHRCRASHWTYKMD